MTKKDLLEAIEDMPMDAEIFLGNAPELKEWTFAWCDEPDNAIILC